MAGLYLVNLIDTVTGERATCPVFRPWGNHHRRSLESGDYSTDNGRHFLFTCAQGVPPAIASKIALRRQESKGRYRVESVQVKGKVVYSEKQ